MNVINSRFAAAVPVSELRPHPRNPRQGDIGAIHQSIEHNGFYGACVVQESSGFILAGNHRFQAALHAGAAAVPVIYVDCDDAVAVRILLADNRSNDLASYDMSALAELLECVRAEFGDYTGTLYDAEAVRNLQKDLAGYEAATVEEAGQAHTPATEVSNAPRNEEPTPKQAPPESAADSAAVEAIDKRDELVEKWRTRPGQIWAIGAHRIMCGDSRREQDVNDLLAGAEVGCVWTDPPYGVSYVGKTAAAMTIENDGSEGLAELLRDVFRQCERVLLPGGPIYIAHPHGPKSLTFAQEFVAAGFHWHQTLVWVKSSIVLGHSDYHYRHEPILYGWKENPEKRVWAGSMYPNRPWYGERNKATVLEFQKPSRSDFHPTTKPTGLIAACLLNSSPPGGVIFEPFSGSGATILAAQDVGRVCYAMELDHKYVAVALEWMSAVGVAPELVREAAD